MNRFRTSRSSISDSTTERTGRHRTSERRGASAGTIDLGDVPLERGRSVCGIETPGRSGRGPSFSRCSSNCLRGACRSRSRGSPRPACTRRKQSSPASGRGRRAVRAPAVVVRAGSNGGTSWGAAPQSVDARSARRLARRSKSRGGRDGPPRHRVRHEKRGHPEGSLAREPSRDGRERFRWKDLQGRLD